MQVKVAELQLCNNPPVRGNIHVSKNGCTDLYLLSIGANQSNASSDSSLGLTRYDCRSSITAGKAL